MEGEKGERGGGMDHLIIAEPFASLRITLLILPSISSASDSPGQGVKCDAVISRDRGAISGPVACTKALLYSFTVNKFRRKARVIYLCYSSQIFFYLLSKLHCGSNFLTPAYGRSCY